MIDLETRRYDLAKAAPVSPEENLMGFGFRRIRPIADFIIEALEASPRTKDKLREMAEEAGYFKGEVAAGRVLHATLMNLERHGRIALGSDGRYEKAPDRVVQGSLVSG